MNLPLSNLLSLLSNLFKCFAIVLQITINRPERRNAFRPQTIKELIRAFNDARDDVSVGVIILTGKVMVISIRMNSSILFSPAIDS